MHPINGNPMGIHGHTKNPATSHGTIHLLLPKVVGESGEEAVQLSGFVGDSSCALAAAGWLQGF